MRCQKVFIRFGDILKAIVAHRALQPNGTFLFFHVLVPWVEVAAIANGVAGMTSNDVTHNAIIAANLLFAYDAFVQIRSMQMNVQFDHTAKWLNAGFVNNFTAMWTLEFRHLTAVMIQVISQIFEILKMLGRRTLCVATTIPKFVRKKRNTNVLLGYEFCH